MVHHMNMTHRKISSSVVVAVSVMLAGILVLSFGYIQGQIPLIYLGVIITLAGILLELFHLVVLRQPDERNM